MFSHYTVEQWIIMVTHSLNSDVLSENNTKDTATYRSGTETAICPPAKALDNHVCFRTHLPNIFMRTSKRCRFPTHDNRRFPQYYAHSN